MLRKTLLMALALGTLLIPLGVAGQATTLTGYVRSDAQAPIPGAVVGGIFIGLLQAYVAGYTPSHLALSTIIPFIVLIVVLMIKPYGLFGEERIERV